MLENILASTHQRIAQAQRTIPLHTLRAHAEYLAKATPYTRSFEKSLRHANRLGYICEVKKASPSKGIIHERFPYIDIAKGFEQAGADAISCLSEPYYFYGSDAYFTEIRQAITLPMLRKDFTIHPYMIYQAKVMQAQAVLLIVRVLDACELKEFAALCEELGLCALIETHNEKEIEQALAISARIIGVNNRDLSSFKVDIHTSLRLRPLVPEGVVFISESGIGSKEDLQRLYDGGVDAVLIGEWFMKEGAQML